MTLPLAVSKSRSLVCLMKDNDQSTREQCSLHYDQCRWIFYHKVDELSVKTRSSQMATSWWLNKWPCAQNKRVFYSPVVDHSVAPVANFLSHRYRTILKGYLGGLVLIVVLKWRWGCMIWCLNFVGSIFLSMDQRVPFVKHLIKCKWHAHHCEVVLTTLSTTTISRVRLG